MRFKQLGNSALQVSEICLGTMTFGAQNSEAEGHAQLDLAFAAGVNFIDTAEMYAVPPSAASYGRSEEIVGNWLARQPRDRVLVATKAAGPGRGLDWIRGWPRSAIASRSACCPIRRSPSARCPASISPSRQPMRGSRCFRASASAMRSPMCRRRSPPTPILRDRTG